MRHANRFDPVALGQAESNDEKSRQHLYVLVTIQMGRADTRRAHFLNLGIPLFFDFPYVETPSRQPQQEAFRASGEPAMFIQQSFHAVGWRSRGPIAQVQMHSDSQPRQLPRGLDAVFKRGAISEQGSAGHDSILMSFGDPAVYAHCPAQIIRVYDEVPHLLRLLVNDLFARQTVLRAIPTAPPYSYTVPISCAPYH